MDDILERLHASTALGKCAAFLIYTSLCQEAADEIERLRAKLSFIKRRALNQRDHEGDVFDVIARAADPDQDYPEIVVNLGATEGG